MGNQLEGNPIAPRLKQGEVLPDVPGMVPTRLDGKIVLVPAFDPAIDTMRGKSPYTVRQIDTLETIRRNNQESRLPHEGTLFEVFFPGELPESDLSDIVIDFSGPLVDHLDYKDFDR
ncbi:MAG: hypothetical protein Q8Q49_04100 [bacterium]|nr:hypothetical protein [bacterium]